MDVSSLLKTLDSLNEEVKQVQNEIHELDGAISKCTTDNEIMKRQIESLDKKINETVEEDTEELCSLIVTTEKLRNMKKGLIENITKAQDDINTQLHTLDTLTETLYSHVQQGKENRKRTITMTQNCINEKRNAAQMELADLQRKIRCNIDQENHIKEEMKKEKAEIQNLITVNQALRERHSRI